MANGTTLCHRSGNKLTKLFLSAFQLVVARSRRSTIGGERCGAGPAVAPSASHFRVLGLLGVALLAVVLLGAGGVQFEPHCHAPAALLVGLGEPVRHDDDRLVDQLESAFRLADRLDRERPEVRRAVRLEADVDPSPLVGQREPGDVAQVEPLAQLADR